MVNFFFFNEFNIVFRRVDEEKIAFGMQHLLRMGLEGDDHTLPIVSGGSLFHERENLPVPPMNPIKSPHRYDGVANCRKIVYAVVYHIVDLLIC